MREAAQQHRARLGALAVEQDEAAADAYLAGEEIGADVLHACIRKGVLANAFVPVLAGPAFRNRGVEPLLDAVVNWLPEPGDAAECDARAPFAALAFKVASDDHGAMVFVIEP
ncbi:hypothetical protein [Variovorax sp. VRV01]|uniref:hypothetical protein n=1 Tax=Variovorax sp. VRV01 TaxID=2769259 RepID=UPI00298BE31C|nr:hypothetical protein [Variovorax sp. VRV01]